MENLEPTTDAWNTNLVTNQTMDIHDPLPLIESEYYNILAKEADFIKTKHSSIPLKFTYTAMHGVGYRYVDRALKSAGVDVVSQIDSYYGLHLVTSQITQCMPFSTWFQQL